VTPLLGAYIADTYLGRFNTICIAVFVAFIGHVILVIAAVPGVIEKSSAIGAFAVSLVVMGLGTGFFKANISPLVAEQYKRTKLFVITRRNGERVIVDPALTVSRVYMVRSIFQPNRAIRLPFQYFYMFINIGALVGQIGMSYSEKVVFFVSCVTTRADMFFC